MKEVWRGLVSGTEMKLSVARDYTDAAGMRRVDMKFEEAGVGGELEGSAWRDSEADPPTRQEGCTIDCAVSAFVEDGVGDAVHPSKID